MRMPKILSAIELLGVSEEYAPVVQAHVNNAINNPELLLTLHGTTASGAVEPIYLRGLFTSADAFNSGKIYRVLYSFSDEDFDQPERCVELNVKVANWTVVPVTPEF